MLLRPALLVFPVLALARPAPAQDLRLDSSPAMAFRPQPPKDQDSAAPPIPRAPPPKHRFGEAGSKWWTIGAGVATDLGDALDWNLPRVAFSDFLADDVEFSFELNGWFFNQPGDNAVGLNPAIIFRWHFLDDGTWTAYADIGVGVLFADDAVPRGGTQFDFMPRIGVGFTRQIAESGVRLQGGLRWHHISNARITGDARNPGRDAAMFYAGLIFPF